MRSARLASILILPALALAACGSKSKEVDVASYTCADFTRSLAKKGDDSAGSFINQLRKQAKLGQKPQTERREVTLAIYFTCRGKPGSTRPAKEAITAAKAIKAGTFRVQIPRRSTKKSNK